LKHLEISHRHWPNYEICGKGRPLVCVYLPLLKAARYCRISFILRICAAQEEEIKTFY